MSKFGFLNKNFNVPKEEAKSEAPKSAKEIKEDDRTPALREKSSIQRYVRHVRSNASR
jgi:hypothetical protein